MTEQRYSIIDVVTTNLISSYETLDEAEADLIELNDPDFVIFEERNGRLYPLTPV